MPNPGGRLTVAGAVLSSPLYVLYTVQYIYCILYSPLYVRVYCIVFFYNWNIGFAKIAPELRSAVKFIYSLAIVIAI